MRSFPSCWNNTLAKLGYRRVPRRRKLAVQAFGRRTRLESLESRQMMAADYLVTTHLDAVNASDGVLSLREAITAAAGDGQNDTDVIEFAPAVIEKGRLTLGGSQLTVNTKATSRAPAPTNSPSTQIN